MLDRFDAHRHDVGTAGCFEQRTGVGGVGLVALDVGTEVGRRQQSHFDTETIEPARPVVRRGTGFHHHPTDRTVEEPAFELGARKAMRCDHPPGTIGDGKLKYGFGQIHSHNRQSSGSIHLGLLLVER